MAPLWPVTSNPPLLSNVFTFSHLLNLASPVCPGCVCLTFDTHLFNICHISTDCQRRPRSHLFPKGQIQSCPCCRFKIHLRIHAGVHCASRLPFVSAVTHSPDALLTSLKPRGRLACCWPRPGMQAATRSRGCGDGCPGLGASFDFWGCPDKPRVATF